MKRIGWLITLFAGLLLVLPTLTAQDGKKDDKTEKKDEAKKDEKKDPDKKDDEKKPIKEKKLAEKMPAHGQVFRTKIVSANGATNREFTIEMKEIDPKKVYDVNTWKAQRAQQLAQQLAQVNQQFAQAATQKDFKARITAQANAAKAKASYDRDVSNFQLEAAKKDVYSAKPLEIRAHDDAKVRTFFLPVMFDDEGRQKKWTEKEKKEFRGDSQMPGYPSDFDAIKSGQFVEIYMHKKPAASKDAPKKKKGPDDDPVEVKTTPEFIVIVILQDGK